MVETWNYNSRLQPRQVSAARSGTTHLQLGFYYCGSQVHTCGDNNGNMRIQTLGIPGQSWTQNYGYDGVNRLASVSETGGAGWSQSFGYDATGNRWVSAYANLVPQPQTPATSNWYNAANNRLNSASYDAAGETTVFVYDATGSLAAEYDSGAATATQGVEYLTADHLGSTRMITNETGTVVARRDYQPFGEEIPASIGGRPPLYDTQTAVKQQFTGKERDTETGLDYFGARYLAGVLGRFVSADPLYGSAHLADPQSWNRYPYATNNPLKYNDPAGLWNWDATSGGAYTDEELERRKQNKNFTRRERNEAKNALTFRANFRAARDEAEVAAIVSGDVSAQQSVAAWGTENDGNNVSVGWSTQSGSSARVMLLPNSDNIVASFNLNLTGNQLSTTVAQEGWHVADAKMWLIGHFTAGALNMNHYYREMRAWHVSGAIAQALGMKQFAPKGGGPKYQVWNRSWKIADVQTLRGTGISNILNNLYGASSTDTNTYSSEHPHRP